MDYDITNLTYLSRKKDFIESAIEGWENPAFKEFVKISTTLLISSLLIYVDMDSESSVLEYDTYLILFNVGMFL